MDFLFFGLACAMIVAATTTVALPFLRDRRTASKSLVAITLLVPLFAVALYSGIGSPRAVTAEADRSHTTESSAYTAQSGSASKALGSVSSLVEGLADRLQREPNDAKGWLLLARSYEHLGRHQDASVAYKRATALEKADPALALTFDSDLSNESSDTAQVAIRGRLSIDKIADTIVEDTDTVFIIAKASYDQRMPIVAVRRSAADLPIDFVLTDKQAMVPGTSLADFDELFVTARISRSGLANDAVAGLEIEGQSVSPLAGGFVELTVSPSNKISNNATVPAE